MYSSGLVWFGLIQSGQLSIVIVFSFLLLLIFPSSYKTGISNAFSLQSTVCFDKIDCGWSIEHQVSINRSSWWMKIENEKKKKIIPSVSNSGCYNASSPSMIIHTTYCMWIEYGPCVSLSRWSHRNEYSRHQKIPVCERKKMMKNTNYWMKTKIYFDCTYNYSLTSGLSTKRLQIKSVYVKSVCTSAWYNQNQNIIKSI